MVLSPAASAIVSRFFVRLAGRRDGTGIIANWHLQFAGLSSAEDACDLDPRPSRRTRLRPFS